MCTVTPYCIIIGSLLGYNLTDPNAIMNQYDFHMNANHSASLKQLTDYVCY